MDNKLSRISNIDREKLDECHYFKSILEEASYLNMLTEEELMLIQMQVIELTDEVVGRYIGIDNSSIRTEEAEQIFESISYAISVCLKTYELPDDALSVLKEKTLKQVYQDGKKRIRGMLNVIKMMYERVKKNTLNIQNIFYLDTIFGGIPGFLKIYDAEFNAQDMKITADYPIYNNLIGKLEGVEFIKEYINSIYLENAFCQKFSSEKIKNLLYAYLGDYKETIFNIFECVFLETIACKLANSNLQDLIISKKELNQITENFKDKNICEIESELMKAYEEIKKEIIEDEVELQKYIEKNLKSIFKRIINAIELNTLDKVFVTQKIVEYE